MKAGHQHFLLFPQGFQRSSISGSLKVGMCGKELTLYQTNKMKQSKLQMKIDWCDLKKGFFFATTFSLPAQYNFHTVFTKKILQSRWYNQQTLLQSVHRLFQHKICYMSLNLSQTSPGFYVSAVQVFLKHCGKRRNCS